MTSELLAEATIAEHQRVYESSRWLREWRRLGAETALASAPDATATAKVEPLARRCPAPETGSAAGR